jgi:hypothetical protein
VLDPVRAVVAGHDQLDGKAVEERDVGAVHLVGDHHFAVHRVGYVERLDEVAAAEHAVVQPVERDLPRGVLQLGARQDVLERHAHPFRVAHRAVRELATGHARREMAAAVAGALVHGKQLHRPELRAQLGDAQRERLADGVAADPDLVGVAVDRRRQAGVVIAHEERVVRRDQALVEHLPGRLELGRARRQHDHRPLLREDGEVAVPVDHRQVDGAGLRSRRAAPAAKRRGGQRAGAAREQATAKLLS